MVAKVSSAKPICHELTFFITCASSPLHLSKQKSIQPISFMIQQVPNEFQLNKCLRIFSCSLLCLFLFVAVNDYTSYARRMTGHFLLTASHFRLPCKTVSVITCVFTMFSLSPAIHRLLSSDPVSRPLPSSIRISSYSSRSAASRSVPRLRRPGKIRCSHSAEH